MHSTSARQGVVSAAPGRRRIRCSRRCRPGRRAPRRQTSTTESWPPARGLRRSSSSITGPPASPSSRPVGQRVPIAPSSVSAAAAALGVRDEVDPGGPRGQQRALAAAHRRRSRRQSHCPTRPPPGPRCPGRSARRSARAIRPDRPAAGAEPLSAPAGSAPAGAHSKVATDSSVKARRAFSPPCGAWGGKAPPSRSRFATLCDKISECFDAWSRTSPCTPLACPTILRGTGTLQ